MSRRGYAVDATALVAGASAALAIAMLTVLAWRHRAFTVDDSFITLRYSANLAAGFGPTWNPGGPPIEGYTSFLWMLLLTVPHVAGVDALAFAKVAGFAAALGVVLSAAWLARRLSDEAPPSKRAVVAAIAVVFTAASMPTAVHAISGMETTLFTFFVTAFFAAALDWKARSPKRATGGPVLAALLALGATLTRPEGNLIAAAAFLVMYVSERERRWELSLTAAVCWLLPYGAYYAWRLSYYGLVAPLSFYVKAMHDAAWLPGADEFLGFAHMFFIAQPYIGVAAVVGAWKCGQGLMPVLLPVGAFVLFFLVPAPIMAYEHRYLFPILPAINAVAAVGVVAVSDTLAAEFGSHRPLRADTYTRAVSVTAILGLVVFTGAHVLKHAEGSIAGWTAYGNGLVRAHMRLGRDLRDLTSTFASPTVALVDVGAVAYVSGWRTIDTFGLNDVHIARTGRHDAAYVRSQDPAIIVFLSQRPDILVPHLAWEQALHDDFVSRGYAPFGSYRFADDYFLLALARPGAVP